ncbi:MAG: DUF1266 domain-containing protein [Oscillospiraceae bacterium]|nr:DUF1266 domain-containing protein [Oscillospiraceae bacterium]MCL2278393.1 DUF1266 domain-containing protein [Oscillospiraceae bacterium]
MRKLYFAVVVLVLFGAMMLITACGVLDGIISIVDNNDRNTEAGAIFDEPFLFGDFEITLSSSTRAHRIRALDSNFDGAYVFSIPISARNIGNRGNSLEHFQVIAFSPDGWSTDIAREGINDETNIFSVGPIQPDVTKTGYIYVVNSGDGEYIIEFNDRGDYRVELRIDHTFDYAAIPLVQTEFALGETIDFNGLKITFMDDFSWGRIHIEWSANFGAIYFYLPVTLHNTNERSAEFPWDFDVFSPQGIPVDSIAWALDAGKTDVTLIGHILPGASVTAYLHVLFSGEGEYRLALRDFLLPDELWVIVPIYDLTPFVYTELSRHLTSPEMRMFENDNAVSAEQQWMLAFGAFIPTTNRESVRVFALGESGLAAERLLRSGWSIEDRESALAQINRLIEADGQSPVADDMFRTLILAEGVNPISETEFFDGIVNGTLPADYQEGLANVIRASRSRAVRDFNELNEENGVTLDDFDDEYAEEIIAASLAAEFFLRIHRGIEANIGAFDLLINLLGFTEEELLSLPTLAAWDYGRVAMLARYSVAAGFLEEEEVWGFMQIAAERASETYSSWREFTAAYILGRALAFGNSSWDLFYTLDFLLNHPESSFQTIDFFGQMGLRA